MGAMPSSEKSVVKVAGLHLPGDGNPNNRRRENLKSYGFISNPLIMRTTSQNSGDGNN
jgi:hypothetical protein